MDDSLVDRIATTMRGHPPRRLAIQALTTTGLGALASRFGWAGAGAKQRRRRCRKRLQSCGGRKKCCNVSGQIQCQAATKQNCLDQGFVGRRCCGGDGASYNPALNDCDCCGDFQCFDLPGGARCVENPK